MFFLQGIISGIVATIIFDLFQISLSFAYNINKSKWNLIGRYFVGLTERKYYIHDINNEIEVKNELLVG